MIIITLKVHTMETIEDNGKIICIIYRNDDWTEGLNFFTPNDMFMQVSSWYYQKGKRLADHIHKDYPRTVNRTQEMTYVKQGKMKVFLFDENKRPLKEFILNQGDLAVYGYGGHGYEIMEDNTQIIETKNGPFIGVENDKEKF